MDAFIAASKALAEQLLPIAGLIVLILLIVLLNNLIKVVKKVGGTLEKTHSTIDLVDTSLTKIQEPLNTVVKVSHGVDSGYDAGVKAIGDAKDYLHKNKDAILEKKDELLVKTDEVIDKVRNLKKTPAPKEPSPEDIIGGK